jgi:hypothetical protein
VDRLQGKVFAGDGLNVMILGDGAQQQDDESHQTKGRRMSSRDEWTNMITYIELIGEL